MNAFQEIKPLADQIFARELERIALHFRKEREKVIVDASKRNMSGVYLGNLLGLEKQRLRQVCEARVESYLGVLRESQTELSSDLIEAILGEVRSLAARTATDLSKVMGKEIQRQRGPLSDDWGKKNLENEAEIVVSQIQRNLLIEQGLWRTRAKGKSRAVENEPTPESIDSVKSMLADPDVKRADFSFVTEARLRQIIERDFAELQRIRTVGATLSRMILAGRLIEGLLLDAVKRHQSKALAASKAPKEKGGKAKNLDQWDLSSLIDVALELGFLRAQHEKQSHGVREFRNLVHPGWELRSELAVREEEANIAEEFLRIVILDLPERSR